MIFLHNEANLRTFLKTIASIKIYSIFLEPRRESEEEKKELKLEAKNIVFYRTLLSIHFVSIISIYSEYPILISVSG